ncbi:MAG: M48 family metallopeptidase [Desulfovibrionaceae bacterium]|nr:M48 family metallopeptidase [Desulfovibrionaceae bacterium]
MLKHRAFFGVSVLLLTVALLAGCRVDPGTMLDAGGDMYKAATLSAEDVKELGKATAEAMDAKNKVAPAGNAYAKRLNKIVASLKNEAGLDLNYKVYLTKDVNAFACPDGSIRVFSGLMDMMDDNELYFVIGHEIGHVAGGDSADKLRLAYAASGARKAAGATGGALGALSRSDLGAIGEALINSQFSQKQEYAADAYGLQLMQKNNKNQQAAVSALRKLATPGRAPSMFDTHPEPGKRADTIAAKIK